MKRILWIFLAVLSGGAVAGQEIKAADIERHIKYLASDELEGRLAVSPGFEKAAAYVASEFKKYGLQPLGTNGYFQPFEMTAGSSYGKNNMLVVDISEKSLDFVRGVDYAPVPGSRHDRWGRGQLAFVGFGIKDDYVGADPSGKVVMMLVEKPEGGPALSERMHAATDAGATGVILVSAGAQGEILAPMLLRFKAADVPVILITRTAAERLLGGKKIMDLFASLNSTGKPQSFLFANSRVRFITQMEPNRGKSKNVIGFLPGNDPAYKDQMIVLGGHLDHLGYGQVGAVDGTVYIHNGADDNASGSAAVMEMAQYYSAKHTNKRGMLFICFGGEEEGLIGSNYFVHNPTVDLQKVTAMVNMDMVGRMTDNKLSIEGVGSSQIWSKWIDEVNTDNLKISKVAAGAGPSDHTGFYNSGIPVVFFFTNLHKDYHAYTDDWDKINYPGEVSVLHMVDRMVQKIDALDQKVPFQKVTQGMTFDKPDTTTPPATGSGRGGIKIRVGLIPDYSFDGPGVLLSGVSPGSPAEKAGLKEGDVILKWGDVTIQDMQSIVEGFLKSSAGTPVKVLIERAKAKIEITVTPEPIDGG
jgi:aminopeptidase YwaD